jgi:hypothetical protein
VLSTVQDPHALEDLTGLTELHSSAAALAMLDADEDEDDEALTGAAAPNEVAASALGQQGSRSRVDAEVDWLEL